MARFCMITTFYPPYSFGGDGVFVEELSRGLAEKGHEVDVIHCIDSYRILSANEVVAPPSPPGVTVHGLRSFAGPLSPLATHQAGTPLFKSNELRRLLASKPFDVLHFHNVSLVGGPGVLGYGEGPALRVYTLHEHWLLCPMHTLFRDNREPCTEKHCIRCSLHYGRPPQWWRYGRLLERSVALVDRFFAPTESVRRIHLASGLPMKISVLGNFHRPLTVAGDDGAPEKPYFLYAGRLEKLKGVHTLIEAFRAYGDADLLIAGEGSESASLKVMAQGCKRIRFLGQVSRERLSGLMAKALAIVVPSIGQEVFPLVVLEAFAVSTPVVARAVGSLEEIVSSSGGGLLFHGPEELIAALRRLQLDEPYRRALGQRGYDAWRANWTLEVHLERYMSLLEELRSGGTRVNAS